MKIKKILLILSLIILLFAASICGAMLYLYHYPSAIKPFIERTVSRSTGAVFTIRALSYSLTPLRVQAKGMTLRTPGDEYGPHLEILGMEADMALSGPFGHKTLTFTSLKIDGFSFQVSEKATLPRIKLKEKRPSLVGRILKGAVALFLFRDMAFQAAEAVNAHVTAEFGDVTVMVDDIRAELNSEHQIAISGSIQTKSPSQNLFINVPRFHVTTDRVISWVAPEITGTLTAKNATLQSPQVSVDDIEAKTKFTYSHKQKAFFFKPADLYLEGITPKQVRDMAFSPTSLQLKTTAFLAIQEKRFKASRLDLNLDDTLKLRGKLDMEWADQTEFRFQALDSHFSAQKLLSLLPDKIRGTLGPISLSGPINLQGTLNGQRQEKTWHLNCDLQSFFRKNQITYAIGPIEVGSSVSGSIRAKGSFPDLEITANLEGDRTVVSGLPIQLEPFKVGLNLSGKHPVYGIEDLSVKIPRARLGLGEKKILVDHVQLQTRKGRLDGREKALFLPEIRLDSSLLKNLIIGFELSGERLGMQLKGKDVRLIQSAVDLELFPPGWQISTRDSLQLNAVLNERGDWNFTSELGLQGLRFQTQDGRSMGEKISCHLRLDGKLDVKNSQIDVKANLKVDKGEVLFDRFYLDLNRNVFLSSIQGHFDLPRRSLKLTSLALELKDILTLHMEGTVHLQASRPHLNLSVNVPRTPLEPLFHHFVLEPFKTERPSLASLKLGGTIAAELKLIGTMSDWIVKGLCHWHGGKLSSADGGFSSAGIDLDLPVWQQSAMIGKESDVSGKKLEGKLSVRSFILAPLPEQSFGFSLNARPNRLSIPSTILLKVSGGKIEIGPFEFRDIYLSHRSVETSLTLDSIQLDPLLSALLPLPVIGEIGGELESVHLEGNALRTKGELRAKVFGGEIFISGLGGSGLFTSTPLLKLNARWKDLHLGDLTRETSFGKIEGILKGHVNDLQIAYGQPQKFDLLLETVKTRGIPQKISVKAVDNIALIGGGQSPFMGLAGSFAAMLREFSYEKIGVHASLENDIFRINGTIKEGGVEYLVKRGSFSGVNVVNQNPDNRISFKDMVKRIRRVTTSKSGPIVK
jgi:hypothetical protein